MTKKKTVKKKVVKKAIKKVVKKAAKKKAAKKIKTEKKKEELKSVLARLPYVILLQPCPGCNPGFTEDQCAAERQVYGFPNKANADDFCEKILKKYPGLGVAKDYPGEKQKDLKFVHNHKIK